MTDTYLLYIYCLDMGLYLKSVPLQSKTEDLELEAVMGAWGFYLGEFLFL